VHRWEDFSCNLESWLRHWSYLRFQLFLWLVVVLSWISNSTTCANDKVNRLFPKSPTKQRVHSDRIQSSSYFSCDVPHLLKTTHNRSSNSFAHSQSFKLRYVGLMQVFIWVGVYRKNSCVKFAYSIMMEWFIVLVITKRWSLFMSWKSILQRQPYCGSTHASILQFDPLQSSHEGMYTCQATARKVLKMRSVPVYPQSE